MMKEVVASDPHYVIEIDQEINCIYFKWNGFWRNENMIPNFLPDVEKLLVKTKPGFAMIVDNRGLITSPNVVIENMIFPSLQMLHKAGLGKSAVILPQEEIAVLNTKRIIQKSTQINDTIPRKVFDNLEDAEHWVQFGD